MVQNPILFLYEKKKNLLKQNKVLKPHVYLHLPNQGDNNNSRTITQWINGESAGAKMREHTDKISFSVRIQI